MNLKEKTSPSTAFKSFEEGNKALSENWSASPQQQGQLCILVSVHLEAAPSKHPGEGSSGDKAVLTALPEHLCSAQLGRSPPRGANRLPVPEGGSSIRSAAVERVEATVFANFVEGGAHEVGDAHAGVMSTRRVLSSWRMWRISSSNSWLPSLSTGSRVIFSSEKSMKW